jgi:hypothetical protein
VAFTNPKNRAALLFLCELIKASLSNNNIKPNFALVGFGGLFWLQISINIKLVLRFNSVSSLATQPTPYHLHQFTHRSLHQNNAIYLRLEIDKQKRLNL